MFAIVAPYSQTMPHAPAHDHLQPEHVPRVVRDGASDAPLKRILESWAQQVTVPTRISVFAGNPCALQRFGATSNDSNSQQISALATAWPAPLTRCECEPMLRLEAHLKGLKN
jgi:hypothetical protein